MLKIGLTGGIGSGKSLISEVFNILGTPVYNADLRAKYLMNSDAVLMTEISNLIGSPAYNSLGKLDTAYVSSRIFNDDNLRLNLNDLVHPAVAKDFDKWHRSFPASISYVIKEAAIMFESGSNNGMDKIVCVSAPVDVRIERVMLRDGKNREQIKKIIDAQLSQDKVEALSDFVIDNSGTDLLIPQVLSLHRTFISRAKA